ncbi:hypothetical protein K458DRAFT_181472 [Lentithecium fluviatile CBS 122367]|uniref:Uncharacterized protein n=1 Tax=Lentithecium fluviatile CBS 122367 TaxID=1168545 RepID=A0A6G1IEZ3_9PLEO|nr:hypothetical protein K458DRAFT_181472 [Lentithecium fluviatile CBS 122367]
MFVYNTDYIGLPRAVSLNASLVSAVGIRKENNDQLQALYSNEFTFERNIRPNFMTTPLQSTKTWSLQPPLQRSRSQFGRPLDFFCHSSRARLFRHSHNCFIHHVHCFAQVSIFKTDFTASHLQKCKIAAPTLITAVAILIGRDYLRLPQHC